MWYIQSSLASISVPSIYCSPFKKYSYLFNNCFKVCISHSVTSNSVTTWTVACQALLSMEFSRQEYWRGLPFSSPGVLPNPGIKLGLLHCRKILYSQIYTHTHTHTHTHTQIYLYLFYIILYTIYIDTLHMCINIHVCIYQYMYAYLYI